jgi:hypothetical protein
MAAGVRAHALPMAVLLAVAGCTGGVPAVRTDGGAPSQPAADAIPAGGPVAPGPPEPLASSEPFTSPGAEPGTDARAPEPVAAADADSPVDPDGAGNQPGASVPDAAGDGLSDARQSDAEDGVDDEALDGDSSVADRARVFVVRCRGAPAGLGGADRCPSWWLGNVDDPIRRCYGRALLADPTLAGQLDVSFSLVGPDCRSIRVVGGTAALRGGELERCMVREMKGLRGYSEEAGVYRIRLRFSLEPDPSAAGDARPAS